MDGIVIFMRFISRRLITLAGRCPGSFIGDEEFKVARNEDGTGGTLTPVLFFCDVFLFCFYILELLFNHLRTRNIINDTSSVYITIKNNEPREIF